MTPRKLHPDVDCEPRSWGIYYILNLCNDRIYIGQTCDLRLRMRRHYQHLTTNRHCNGPLQRDWNIYGEKLFEFSVLTTVDKTALNRDETLARLEKMFIIKVYRSHHPQFGYNIMPGNRFLGRART